MVAEKFADRLAWIKPEGLGQMQKFANVNPTLSALEAADPALIFTQKRGKIALPEALPFPLMDEESDQRIVTVSADDLHLREIPLGN